MQGVGSRILSHALRKKRLPFLATKLDADHFNGMDREVYLYLQEHLGRHGAAPSLRLVQERFPDFPISKPESTDQDFLALVDDLRSQKRIGKIADALRSGAEELSRCKTRSHDIDNLVSGIENKLHSVHESQLTSGVFSMRGNAATFCNKDYGTIQALGGAMGLLTGISQIDEAIHGFKGGELIALVGFAGEGKSYLATLLAGCMWFLGTEPAIFSLEMDADSMARRMYVVMSGVSIDKYLSGDLDQSELDRIDEMMEQVEALPSDLLIDDDPSLTPESFKAKMQEYGSDFGVIDYLGLMQGTDKDNLDNTVRDLKLTARSLRVPVLLVAQATKDAGDTKAPPKMNQVGGGMPLVKHADIIMSFSRTNSIYTVKVWKNRNAFHLPTFKLTWDIRASGFNCSSSPLGEQDFAQDI